MYSFIVNSVSFSFFYDYSKFTNILLILIISALLYQYKKWENISKKKPNLYFNKNDEKLKLLINSTKSFHESYKPPLFYGKNIQMIFMTIRNYFYKNSLKFERELIETSDKGLLAIDWISDQCENKDKDKDNNNNDKKQLTDYSPIVCFLHTLTGNFESTITFLNFAKSRNWRACVLLRRGHGNLKLKSAKFNIMGDTKDTELIMKKIRKKYPNSFIAMVGISAGSGQLVSYLGKSSENCIANAAASLCPAYDISNAFNELSNFFSNYLTKCMQDLFIKNNEKILIDEYGTEKFKQISSSKKMHEFINNHYHYAGCRSIDEYWEDSNPVKVFEKNKIPCMILNSLDDPICKKENILFDQFSKFKNYVLLTTEIGSHIAFMEGFFAKESWMERVTMDWLESCRIKWMEENTK
jgi:predicted alpha/beta-fold hydrolase